MYYQEKYKHSTLRNCKKYTTPRYFFLESKSYSEIPVIQTHRLLSWMMDNRLLETFKESTVDIELQFSCSEYLTSMNYL